MISSPRAPTLLVMAAGLGSRYGGLKQLESFGPQGETLLDYSVHDAWRAGFGRVVFVIRRDFEAEFREKVGRRFEPYLSVGYAGQELDRLPPGCTVPAGRVKPWGTAHAVWCAREELTGPFTAINADDFYGREAFARLAEFLARERADRGSGSGSADESRGDGEAGSHPICGAMAGFRLGDTLSEHGSVARGVCRVDERGRLSSIEEMVGIERGPGGTGQVHRPDGSKLMLAADTTVSMNCWAFERRFLDELDRAMQAFFDRHGRELAAECYLPAVVADAIAAGRMEVEVLPTRSVWFGVTHRADRPRVTAALQALIARGEYPEALWS